MTAFPQLRVPAWIRSLANAKVAESSRAGITRLMFFSMPARRQQAYVGRSLPTENTAEDTQRTLLLRHSSPLPLLFVVATCVSARSPSREERERRREKETDRAQLPSSPVPTYVEVK